MMGDTYVIFDLSSAELTRSILTPRALLDQEQTSATRIKTYHSKNVIEEKRESTQSTLLTLVAWILLLAGTWILANSAIS